jgi:8-oxo-dGTP pyrophosphatase MutT (NUDIX family)
VTSSAELRTRFADHLRRHDLRTVARGERRSAAVAITVAFPDDGPDAEPYFLLTRRAPKLRAHSGQLALPGGRIDAGETPEEAALRELQEELGVDLPASQILGRLDDYATRSGFVMTPVVVWAGVAPEVVPAPSEVAEVFDVPLAHLERKENPIFLTIPESDAPVIQMSILEHHIHAPTAAVLYQFREVAMHGRDTRVAHLEAPVWAWK